VDENKFESKLIYIKIDLNLFNIGFIMRRKGSNPSRCKSLFWSVEFEERIAPLPMIFGV